MCERSLANTSRSISLEMVLRLYMGRKFDGLLVSRPKCYNSGVTWASLNRVDKVPSVNERFARHVMRGMNTLLHRLIMEVGTKSMGDDLEDMLPSSFCTSSSVAGCRSSNASPVCALSNMKGPLSLPINLFTIKSIVCLVSLYWEQGFVLSPLIVNNGLSQLLALWTMVYPVL